MARMPSLTALFISTALLCSAAPLVAQSEMSRSETAPTRRTARRRLSRRPPLATAVDAASDSAAVAEVVHHFHHALEAADSTAALALLTDDAVVQESGGMETKQEYRSHHLPSDIAFARAVRRESGPVRVAIVGDAAWATSTGTTRGTFRGRTVNSQGAELMVLVRTPAGWRIAVIHWSSRALRD